LEFRYKTPWKAWRSWQSSLRCWRRISELVTPTTPYPKICPRPALQRILSSLQLVISAEYIHMLIATSLKCYLNEHLLNFAYNILSSHVISFYAGCSDEYDVMIPSPESYMTYSTSTTEHYQTMSPPHCMLSSAENMQRNGERGVEWFDLPNHNQDLSSSAFFWMQLLKEENQLWNTSDAELLATDKCGRT